MNTSFTRRGIATITYRTDQLAPGLFKGGTRGSGNFMGVFPGSTAGYMIRWAWGVILRSKFSDVDRGKWIPWTTPELK